MKRRVIQRRVVVFLLLLGGGAIVTGCAGDPLHIPQASQLTALLIADGRQQGSDTRTVSDSAVIGEFVAFLARLDTRWNKPWGTFPTPQYRVFFEGTYGSYREGVPSVIGSTVVFLGENWIAVRAIRQHSSETRIRSLSREELAEVHIILDL